MIKHGVHLIPLITYRKDMRNNFVSCFNRINYDVIPSYIKLPWFPKTEQLTITATESSVLLY